MVLEVVADAGQVARHLDANCLQLVAGPDAGEHQQLGRAEGAGGEDRLARGALRPARGRSEVTDAGGAVLLHLDAETWAPLRRP